MPIAAVPNYLSDQDAQFYLSAPPGHRFLLYFPVWGENLDTGKIDWRMKDRVPKIDKKTKQQKISKAGLPEWEDLPNDQFGCTVAACKTPEYDEERPRARKPREDQGLKPWLPLMNCLLARQTALAATVALDQLFRLDAQAQAPFTTGLGNEHPLENGFAFLNPYGLPYLPGSGVKGVVRRAAQELAKGLWEDDRGWKGLNQPRYRIKYGSGKNRVMLELSVLDVLFGREPPPGDANAVRGALAFWDVIPQIQGDSLMVEIMTPHQGHYYQQKQEKKSGDSTSPHDSGQPNPISFLTVPPGSGFTFYVVCDRRHLERLTRDKLDGAPDLLADERWKKLTEAAFTHAFEWLGFGAKTAVGYGAMETPRMRQARSPVMENTSSSQPATPHTQALAVSETETIWPAAKLTYNAGSGEIKAVFEGKSTAGARGELAKEILAGLGDRAEQLKKKKELKGVSVRVRIKGNLIELLGLQP